MFVGTIWVYESTYSTVNFMKSKHKSSISDENVVLVLKCATGVIIHFRFQTLGKM